MYKLSKLIFVAFIAIILEGCPNSNATLSEKELAATDPLLIDKNAPPVAVEPAKFDKTDYILAHIKTNKGEIVCDLEFEKTPVTVANFIGLAEGKIENSCKTLTKPFYDGLTFHRVVDNFMIQGGDPKGNGMGDPGYKFMDEFDPTLTFNTSGILAMANSGPGTNGSQFFITHLPTEFLNNKHTIFGHVVTGQNIVNAIKAGDIMESITIEIKGDKANAFDAVSVFNNKKFKTTAVPASTLSQELSEFNTWVKKNYPKAKKYGEMYILVTQKGSGAIPKNGQQISANYTGKFIDGKKFDSSLDGGVPFTFNLGAGMVIKGWDEGFAKLNIGSKATLLIPYTYGYGEQGSPGNIPPKATLVFDVELMGAK